MLLSVSQAAPIVSVSGVNLTYGTALDNSEISGTASWTVGGNTVSVPGTFSFIYIPKNVLGADVNPIEPVRFTPADSTDYKAVNLGVRVTVSQASPDVSVSPVNLTAGMALDDSQLKRECELDGRRESGECQRHILVRECRGHALGRGNGQSESVIFTPDDTTDYTAVVTSVTVNVAQPVSVYVDASWSGQSYPLGTPVYVASNVEYVGYNAFATIQAAVLAVAPGGTVNIASGTYTEQVVINQSLTLSGAGSASTTIQAPVNSTGAVVGISGGSLVTCRD